MKPLFFVVLVFTLFAFRNEPGLSFKWADMKKHYAKTTNSLFVSKYEVSNLEYRIFLDDIKHSGKRETYLQCLPDTTVWHNEFANNEPFVNYYFRHPSYNDYPVVGITYEASKAYCNWLTDKANQEPKRKFKAVQFKLPSKDEWVFAANAGDTNKVYTWGRGYMQNNKKMNLANFRHTDTDGSNPMQKNIITASVGAYYPSTFGLYNMCGNVAEMIEEKGIAQGGSFADPAYKVRILSEKKYSKPQADIGFRVAMKVLEE